ncbi:MAG: hypothetical protein ACRDUV_08875 [Pseudonocardiaceae bacterium]
MSSPPRDDTVDLRNVYNNLAAALGSAHHQATLGDCSPDRLVAVNQTVQKLWSLTVQRLGAGLEQADLSDIPPTVEPDLQASADLDVNAILDHVAAFEPAAVTPQPPWSPFGWVVSVRTAALVWCAVTAILAVVLGVIGGEPVVVSASLPPIATGLLLAWRGVGRVPGVFWAVGLVPLVFLVVAPHTAVAFVVLVEGFAYLTFLSSSEDGSWQHEPRARRRPLEIELVLYSLAAWTTGNDLVVLLFIACLAGLIWRRRWTAATAAAVTGFVLLLTLSPTAVLNHGPVYAVLAVHWVRAIFHGPWLAGRLSMTEIGLTLSGRALRGGWRIAQRTVENALPPLTPPARGNLFQGLGSSSNSSSGDGLRYCWTCHMKTQHKSAGFSLPICQRCVGKADKATSRRTFSQSCPVCHGRIPHTDGGKCLSCWKKGR